MLFILGFIPYIVIGIVLATLGVSLSSWQFYVILACQFASDTISYFKGAARN